MFWLRLRQVVLGVPVSLYLDDLVYGLFQEAGAALASCSIVSFLLPSLCREKGGRRFADGGRSI